MYLKNYVKHPFKIKGYILMNFAICWKNPGESTDVLLNLNTWQRSCIYCLLFLGIDIKIVHQVSTKVFPNIDPIILEKMGLAQVRFLDLQRLLGNGILHSKMWLVDGKHFYVGSANMDWRSLTQVWNHYYMKYDYIQYCTCISQTH